ncbi:MAG: hypothetical protein M0P37_00460 [Synergistaceae bacterium]|jgi:hypothetical protein|nr:hypothetical protein [Synergistaceae bacterium]MCK9558354.1 hypothetical protein [Candidatus Cloacimonadota bacterium]MCK9437009.1 hypothetical protein [Synergistaceae bacterium]MDD3672885.1 hypothetical protein [Synergistaceae bacterium]MDD5421335.1 hypothetical protein [Synergistaceae bacterium]
MKITNEAKTMLEGAFASNDCDCLKAVLQKSCCGTSLVFNLAKLEEGDEPTTINGISMLMEDDTMERAETVTITVENGELAIQDEASSGCC